ncbi:MAG: glycosyltransferase family 39 protein [Elusimicrobia bacterium]|nr:glycosyltransferase family 39 protein [Candidatus Liberimonas magnetica]
MKPNNKCYFLLFGCYPFIWIALIVLLIYSKTTGFDFLNYDESSLIVKNQSFLKDPGSIYAVFLHGIHADFSHFYRPLYMLSLMIDAHISGLNSFGYHISNILFHIIASWLIYIFFKKLNVGGLRSFVFAVFFAVHPLVLPSVAWVPGRNDSLLGIGVLASFIFLIDYLERHRTRDFYLHILFTAVSLLIKETAVAVFPVAVAFLILMRERASTADRKALLTGWGITAAAYFAANLFAIRYDNIPYQYLFPYSWHTPRILLWYFGNIFFPFNLSVAPFAEDINAFAGICVVCGLSLLLYLSKGRQMRKVWFGTIWAIFFLLPTLIINKEGIYFIQRSYVPLAGVFLIMGEIRGPLWDNMILKYRNTAASIIVLAGILLSVISLNFTGFFSDSEYFWQNAARTSPHSFLVNNNLGATYEQLTKYDKALQYYYKAAELKPDDPHIHCLTAKMLILLGRQEEAIREYEKALNIDPGNIDAKNGISILENTGFGIPQEKAHYLKNSY